MRRSRGSRRARRAGCDVDLRPVSVPRLFQTGLTNSFAAGSRDGGTDAFLARLTDPSTAPRMRTEALGKIELIGGWDNVMIVSVRAPEDKAAEGKRLGAYATALGKDPYALTVEMLGRNRASISMVGFAMSEDNLERILAHPQSMVCSDGGAFAIDGPTRRGSPHPRGLGTFPRVLGRYVRERKTLTLAQAINKMSGMPAARMRLARSGAAGAGVRGGRRRVRSGDGGGQGDVRAAVSVSGRDRRCRREWSRGAAGWAAGWHGAGRAVRPRHRRRV